MVPLDHPSQPPRRLPGPATLTFAFLMLVLGGFVVGFVSFLHEVPTQERVEIEPADAIVALTGGAERLADAMALLAEGRARRLLISGVNPSTSDDELRRQVPRYAMLASCCVDLDRRAANTVGNARETGRWVRDRGFRSLIVVTSSYHMPRALMELERALPDVALIPYPVVTERLKEGPWWQSGARAKLLLSEYVKYVAAVAKLRLAPEIEPVTQAAAGRAARL